MTTILTNFVGRSVVSAITQTPASGPFGAGDDAADVVGVDANRVAGGLARQDVFTRCHKDQSDPGGQQDGEHCSSCVHD